MEISGDETALVYGFAMPNRDVAATFLRWTFMRAVFHRGWWLATSLYLVAVADLSAFQLVFLGTAQNVTALAFELPTGVIADTISRKRSIVLAHLLMGIGMLATGLVTSFPALVATQMLWGLSWTFSSGADTAWLTDELDDAGRTASTLTAGARIEQLGAAVGLMSFGALSWLTDLSTSIVVAGTAMMLLSLYVMTRFTEHHFTKTRVRKIEAAITTLRNGVALVRGDRAIMVVFIATIAVNGAAEAFDRLYPKRLIELGLPDPLDPIVWLTLLGLIMLAAGATALRIVEARIEGIGAAQWMYAIACGIGAVGLAVITVAPDAATGMAGALLVGGIALSVTRTVGVIWVNRRTTSDVRATVQSLLAQAEYCGEIFLGLTLAVLAQTSSIATAMLGSCLLVAGAGVLVGSIRNPRERGA